MVRQTLRCVLRDYPTFPIEAPLIGRILHRPSCARVNRWTERSALPAKQDSTVTVCYGIRRSNPCPGAFKACLLSFRSGSWRGEAWFGRVFVKKPRRRQWTLPPSGSDRPPSESAGRIARYLFQPPPVLDVSAAELDAWQIQQGAAQLADRFRFAPGLRGGSEEGSAASGREKTSTTSVAPRSRPNTAGNREPSPSCLLAAA
jgi:hypothetical protein